MPTMSVVRRALAVAIFAYYLESAAVVCASPLWELTLFDKSAFPLAVCLDGSAAGYWTSKGFESGVDNYVIHHQGGGWCLDAQDCLYRSRGRLGSSTAWEHVTDCEKGSVAAPCIVDGGNHGIFSRNEQANPLFFNWNHVYVGYCDGASFSGTMTTPVPAAPGKMLYFQGKHILDATYDSLLLGQSRLPAMSSASDIVVSGTSAGALAVYLHIDEIADTIREFTKRSQNSSQNDIKKPLPRVVGVPDAGFFMDIPSVDGNTLFSQHFEQVYKMQHVRPSLDRDCLAHYRNSHDTWKCFMAYYSLPFVTSPLFVINSLVDSWQGFHIMGLTKCNPRKQSAQQQCTSSHIDYLNNFRSQLVNNSSMTAFLEKPSAGAWLLTCYEHCLLHNDHYFSEVNVQGMSMQHALADWYRGMSQHRVVYVDKDMAAHHC